MALPHRHLENGIVICYGLVYDRSYGVSPRGDPAMVCSQRIVQVISLMDFSFAQFYAVERARLLIM